MKEKKEHIINKAIVYKKLSVTDKHRPGRIFPTPEREKHLDVVQLHKLEQAFRDWVKTASRADVRLARKRILLIFLLIRYTGAKLNEVLGVNPLLDINFERQSIRFGRVRKEEGRPQRKVQLPKTLCEEIREILSDPAFKDTVQDAFNVDPGFLRRKFYERAEACGLAKELGAPEVLRKSRAVELMQHDMPLPAVQVMLGHSTPNLTSSYVSFSEEEIQQVTRLFMERESSRRTSARNSFYGKIQTLRQGDIQTWVELLTLDGFRISTVITNDSTRRLGLKVGRLITAEVKAPWVLIQKQEQPPESSADNILGGTIEGIKRGGINTEYIVRISERTSVCAIVTSESAKRLSLAKGDKVWVLFNGASVVLLSETGP